MCLFCGGLAERGFVQLNALSIEVQYVTDKLYITKWSDCISR